MKPNYKQNLLDGLNKDQAQAVQIVDGPVLVLAGAGSGKTRTLVSRLAYLIVEHKIDPVSILAVTFTNKGAQEMRNRVSSLLGKNFGTTGPLIGTFHAVSCRFLRQEAKALGYPIHFSIYDEDDQKSLIKEAMRDVGISTKSVQPGAIVNAISRAKAELILPTEYGAEVAYDYFTENVARVYTRYQELLRINKAFDFDDLIINMVKIWQDSPSILERYQKHFRYILIDEYQDVNKAQYIWTKLLAAKYKNLCVVGDDWQSIYGWRGADFGNILRFAEDYSEAKVIKLEQNYRSTKVIVAASNAVMAKAELKADKTLWTNNILGDLIKVVEVEDEVAEARFVVEEVIKLAELATVNNKSNISKRLEIEIIPEYEDRLYSSEKLPDYMIVKRYQGSREALRRFVVLYRTNAQSRALEEACLRAGLPYQLVGAIRFYERREIKDVLAYLRFILNPDDRISFERAILSSPRGVGLGTVEAILSLAKEKKISLLEAVASEELGISGSRYEGLTFFISLIRRLIKDLPKLQVSELIDEVVLRGGMHDRLSDGSKEGSARLENIEELKTVANSRASGQGKVALEKFLTDVSLWQDQDSFDDEKGGLTLMTVHAAKGLEFATVFIVGFEEGFFPHTSSLDNPKELEEERRLAYVALTRAKEKVYCLHTTSRRIFGKVYPGLPSRFIGELPEEYIDVSIVNPF